MSSHFSSYDYQFMAQAIKLAKQGHYTTTPNPRVGCVLTKNNQIIGQGFHIKAGTGHAEINALKSATQSTEGSTAYVTLEPCSHFGRTPPCAQALIDANVSRVVIAMVDPNPKVSGNGIAMLKAAGINTVYGLLAQEAEQLNVGFLKLMNTGFPFVRLKMATSMDGKTAMANGESQWITGPEARQDVQRLRAQSCAIISGADSVILDNARLTVRQAQLPPSVQQLINQEEKQKLRQPVRVIIDGQNKLTPSLALFEQETPIIIIRTTLENIHQWPHFVEQVELPLNPNTKKVDLVAVLAYLGQQGLNDVLIETGARLAGAFIEQGLVDELVLYQAPKLMGGDAKSMVSMPSIQSLTQSINVSIKDVTMVGSDLRIVSALTNKN